MANNDANYRREDVDRLLAFIDSESWARFTVSLGVLPRCLGGPIDGMLVSVAETIGRREGAYLFVPSLLVLTSPNGVVSKMEHQYARDHSRGGALTYVGQYLAGGERA